MFLRRLFPSTATHLGAASAPPLAAKHSRDAASGTSIGERADALCAEGRYGDALTLIDTELERRPDDGALQRCRGTVLYRWGRVHEARAAFRRAVDLSVGDDAEASRALGWSQLWTGDREGAEQSMASAVAANGRDWAAHFGAAVVALAAGRVDDARDHLTRARELDPGNPTILNVVVLCHLTSGDAAAAEAAAREALRADESEQMAWSNLAVALARQRRFAEMEVPFRRALALARGEGSDAFVNYCNGLREAGRLADALRLYEEALRERPSVIGHCDYAFALMMAGRLPEGFQQYEFRWLRNDFVRAYPSLDCPVWNGQSLAGRTLLVWVEQGFGDTIQYIRYAPWLKALGATVFVLVREGLESLVGACPGVDRVIARDEELPAIDFHCPMMSLPRVFGTERDSVPAALPYIVADAGRVNHWRSRLPATGKPRVGLVWAGSPGHANDGERSATVAALRPVLRCPDVQFVALQKGDAAAQIADAPPDAEIIDVGMELGDFADTAAVIDQLDLVICVDTSVAHLAGALGKPTWILLPRPADFRWMEEGEDTPWYPTARLFRKAGYGDWNDVIARVAAELDRWVARGRGGAVEAVVRRPVPHVVGPEDAFGALQPGYSAFARTRYGLLQYLPDEPVVGPSLGILGEARPAQVDLVLRLTARDAVVLDAMPGVGAHSVMLSHRIGVDGHLLCFEPRRFYHRMLRQNLGVNGVANFTALHRALGAQSATGNVDPGEVRRATLIGRVPDTDGAVDTIDAMRLARLDLLVVADGAPLADILAGAEETIWRLRPLLFIGAADERAVEAAFQACRAFSYRVWRHESPLFSAENFNRIDDDCFRGAMTWAVVCCPEEFEVGVELEDCRELV